MKYEIPKYYTDKTLTEKQKRQKDWEMIGKDFPIREENIPPQI